MANPTEIDQQYVHLDHHREEAGFEETLQVYMSYYYAVGTL